MEIFSKITEIIGNSDCPTIIELGMCDGYHTQKMLDILSLTGKKFIFHGFEPVLTLYNNIQVAYNSEFGSVSLFNLAIGSNNKISDFYISGGSKKHFGQIVDNYYGSSSLRKPKLVLEAWTDMTFQKEQIQVVTLDKHIQNSELNGKIIDFIWADIQGAEVDMIKGGKKAFKNVRYLYTEYCDAELYDGEIGLSEICKLLPDFEIIFDYGGDVLLKNTKL
jgi:FkbM family methyltransferase